VRAKSKIQIPNSKQDPKSKSQAGVRTSSGSRSVFCTLKFAIWILFGIWILGFGISVQAATNSTSAASRNIGIEGKVTVALPKPDYKPRSLDDRTELILRIESVKPLPNGQHRYELFYMGLEPGSYRLADFLIRPDGTTPDEVGDLRIQVRAMLPDNHDGKLNAYVPRAFPFIGGYRARLGVVTAIWVGGIAAFIIASRKKRIIQAPALIVPQPSFAERLRPLVEDAAAGKLNVEGQAHLERLLMGYWRERLNLPELRMADSLARLKAHAEAGELLRALERWLHRPNGARHEEIAELLQMYRNNSAARVKGAAA
jgi:hypothetical protein